MFGLCLGSRARTMTIAEAYDRCRLDHRAIKPHEATCHHRLRSIYWMPSLQRIFYELLPRLELLPRPELPRYPPLPR